MGGHFGFHPATAAKQKEKQLLSLSVLQQLLGYGYVTNMKSKDVTTYPDIDSDDEEDGNNTDDEDASDGQAE